MPTLPILQVLCSSLQRLLKLKYADGTVSEHYFSHLSVVATEVDDPTWAAIKESINNMDEWIEVK